MCENQANFANMRVKWGNNTTGGYEQTQIPLSMPPQQAARFPTRRFYKFEDAGAAFDLATSTKEGKIYSIIFQSLLDEQRSLAPVGFLAGR